jgi:hypothetical protein
MSVSQRQAIVIADMIATALIKADMWGGGTPISDPFRKDLEYEMSRFNTDGEYNEIYRAINNHLNEE